VGGSFCHAPGAASGTKTALLTRKGDELPIDVKNITELM